MSPAAAGNCFLRAICFFRAGTMSPVTTPGRVPTETRTRPRNERGPRLENIDRLRGMLALGVLFYHYGWYIPFPDFVSDTLMKVGIFAVPGFYVVSGISFRHVYANLSLRPAEMGSFWVKRIFRIWPVYAIAVFTTIALSGRLPPMEKLVHNLTLTFGFFKAWLYIPGGGWSIGNEIVFYSAFPFLLFIQRRTQIGFLIIIAAAVGLFLHFTFRVLHPAIIITSQFPNYVHPLNQIVFFVVGMFLADKIGAVRISRRRTGDVLLVIGFLFVAYPVWGGVAAHITGFARIYFSLLVVAACAVFALGDVQFSPRWGRLLSIAGAWSYSIYLLHPLVLDALPRAAPWLEDFAPLTTFFAFVVTMLVAWLCYRFVEAPAIRAGYRLAFSFNDRR